MTASKGGRRVGWLRWGFIGALIALVLSLLIFGEFLGFIPLREEIMPFLMTATLPVLIVYVFIGMRESQSATSTAELLAYFGSATLITSLMYFMAGSLTGWLLQKTKENKSPVLFRCALALLLSILTAVYCWLLIKLFYQ